MNVLICDPISPKGIALFQQRPEFNVVVLEKRLSESELLPLLSEAVAIVVRSETKITGKLIEAAPKLKAVGRAGVGTDNVDVEAATQRGIVVMNTPGGNTISTAELTFAMLMALARKIPQAHMSMKAGEWNRKAFSGVELYNKTLGILGMGRIGGEVARRAIAFGMRVLAYDPYLALARAKALQVELVENLDEIYARSDFITVHMPMTEETKGMINAAAFAKMKKGVRVHQLRSRRHYRRERSLRGHSIGPGRGRCSGCLRDRAVAGNIPVARFGPSRDDAAFGGEHGRGARECGH